MRNGRDPKLTLTALGHIEAIARHTDALLELKHPVTGMPALQHVSRDELALLDRVPDLAAQIERWGNVRRQQGLFSQTQKIDKRIQSLQEEIDQLEVRKATLVEAAQNDLV